ncbi:hypothetical protein [Rossellomorea aquimaris]|uniref:hypothetical protein n=1 Tax=Rossellomorea aquimaris TaxID=189382 RepID=UPI0006971CAF|nr:hypothetical protein [Rossellomorea aquimaris]
MVNEFDDLSRRYHDHYDDEENCEGDPDEQDELCTGDPDEQENLCIGDPHETDEDCEGDPHDQDECSDDHEKPCSHDHCSDHDFDRLPCKSVEGVLNSMFHLGDHLEVFFEDEMIGCGGTFVAAYDNILIWMDHKANVNFTDLCGQISIRKIGSKRKKTQKQNDKKQKDDKKNDKKQKDKKDKKDKKEKKDSKEKDSRKKDVKKAQSAVNEEVLNFVKLEKEEPETEERSQLNLNLLQDHRENEINEDDISSLENFLASDKESLHHSSGEKEEEINLDVEDDFGVSNPENEYITQLDTDGDHSEITDAEPVIEELTFENDIKSDEVNTEEEDSETSEEDQALSLVDDEGDLSGEDESVEMNGNQDEGLLIGEEAPIEDDPEPSPINSMSEENKE